MAAAQAEGFSDAALQRANGLTPGDLAIAERHDPFSVTGAAQRDRESADFAARLDRAPSGAGGVTAVSLMLRPDLGPEGDTVARRMRFASIGALDGARDLDCLTEAVYYEARGESDKGQAAVAQVVLNRVRHPAFPKTICAVVFQGAGAVKSDCQFSFVCDGSMRAARDDEAWDKAQRVAARALSGARLADIGAATHFHVSGLADQWGEGLIRVTQVGMHVFYRFGHARAAPQAEKKPVLAGLPEGAEPAKTEAKPEASVKDSPIAAMEPPKPVVSQAVKTAPLKAESPRA